jgi:hypothetical protein
MPENQTARGVVAEPIPIVAAHFGEPVALPVSLSAYPSLTIPVN